MFIAMNRFRVSKGAEADFEHVWLSRDSHLDKVPGFIEFHLLKGPEAEDHTLYASHTVWESQARVRSLDQVRGFPGRPSARRGQQAALSRTSAIRGVRGSPDGRARPRATCGVRRRSKRTNRFFVS